VALRFRGGERAARLRLEHFSSSGLAKYKDTRNESLGWGYSSKLSPWLAAGCISPRQIFARVAEHEAQCGGETVHTYWVQFELMWRDYCRLFAAKHGVRIFSELGPAGSRPGGVEWAAPEASPEAAARLAAWKAGRTGIPWVDGHMRELALSGFMSNRGRQNVASFLVLSLGVDWRHGARHFEQHLIDHDVTANWVNWVMAAGVGAKGSRVNRFNMDKQARDYDPAGQHARAWVSELAGVPPTVKSLHDLALRAPVPAKPAQRTLDGWISVSRDRADDESVDYPRPIVSIRESAQPPGGHRHKARPHVGKNSVFVTN
jgi:deoxyribodipyrimidine photo-lyase